MTSALSRRSLECCGDSFLQSAPARWRIAQHPHSHSMTAATEEADSVRGYVRDRAPVRVLV